MRKHLCQLLEILFILLLSGCGFQLVGDFNVPPKFQKVYLHSFSPYSDLTKTVRQYLQASHFQVVSQPEEASFTLDLLSDNFTTTQTTVGASDQMQNYTATYSVTYDLKDQLGRTIAGPFTSQEQENITVLQNEVLSNSSKSTQAQQDLTHTITEDIFFHLTAKNTIAALEKAESARTVKAPKTATPVAAPPLTESTPTGFYGSPFIVPKTRPIS